MSAHTERERVPACGCSRTTERILQASGIAFSKEDELREKGFDKTPDFKLLVPIYLKTLGTSINWIDSKATFGDQQSHSDYYDSQFKYYVNRFGSGLVIYWFGFLADIQKLAYNSNKNQTANRCVSPAYSRGNSISQTLGN